MMPVLPLLLLAAAAAPAGNALAGPSPRGGSTAPRTAARPAEPGAAVVRATDPGPDRPVTRLVSPDDVARLCGALEPTERLRVKGDAVQRGEAEERQEEDQHAALNGRYEVVVSATGLAFAPYDGPERRLSLVEPVQVPFADGTARLWPTEERSLAVDVDAGAARRIIDAQRGGRLGLAIVFDLPDDASCGKGARGKKLTLPVEPVSWSWIDGDAVLARGGAGVEWPLFTAAQGARPHVSVGEPIAGPTEAKKAVLARAGDLEACYAQALRRDPGLDGVLVADLGGGRSAISADSVGDGELAVCVQRVLAPLAPAQGRVSIPLRFELDPPGLVRPATRE